MGDALGTTLEFSSPGTFTPISDMVGGGPFNLGDDADTTGAVYSQLAGAFYGEDHIPAAWRDTIAQRELIKELADKLCAAAQTVTQGAA